MNFARRSASRTARLEIKKAMLMGIVTLLRVGGLLGHHDDCENFLKYHTTKLC